MCICIGRASTVLEPHSTVSLGAGCCAPSVLQWKHCTFGECHEGGWDSELNPNSLPVFSLTGHIVADRVTSFPQPRSDVPCFALDDGQRGGGESADRGPREFSCVVLVRSPQETRVDSSLWTADSGHYGRPIATTCLERCRRIDQVECCRAPP